MYHFTSFRCSLILLLTSMGWSCAFETVQRSDDSILADFSDVDLFPHKAAKKYSEISNPILRNAVDDLDSDDMGRWLYRSLVSPPSLGSNYDPNQDSILSANDNDDAKEEKRPKGLTGSKTVNSLAKVLKCKHCLRYKFIRARLREPFTRRNRLQDQNFDKKKLQNGAFERFNDQRFIFGVPEDNIVQLSDDSGIKSGQQLSGKGHTFSSIYPDDQHNVYYPIHRFRKINNFSQREIPEFQRSSANGYNTKFTKPDVYTLDNKTPIKAPSLLDVEERMLSKISRPGHSIPVEKRFRFMPDPYADAIARHKAHVRQERNRRITQSRLFLQVLYKIFKMKASQRRSDNIHRQISLE